MTSVEFKYIYICFLEYFNKLFTIKSELRLHSSIKKFNPLTILFDA